MAGLGADGRLFWQLPFPVRVAGGILMDVGAVLG